MKIDRTFLMLFLFVVMVLVFLAVRPKEPTSGISVEEYIYLKVFAKQKYEVVFAGDSTIESGVDGDEFTKLTGHASAFNFGFGGGGFYKIYLDAVEERVDMTSSNPTIILGLTAHSLTEHSVNNNNFNAWSLEYSADSFNFLIPPSWRYAFRPVATTDVNRALRGEHLGYSWIMQANGWVATSRNPETDSVQWEERPEDFEEQPISDRMITMLTNACKRWREDGIDVYVFLPPFADNTQELSMKHAGADLEKLRRTLEEVGATWLTVPDQNYHYCDGVHIHYDDAPRFSRDLAKAYLSSRKQ